MAGEKLIIIELYKLHAELADRVSQRRERANQLYVSLLSALLVLAGLVTRFGVGGDAGTVVLLLLILVGCIVAISWGVVIRSYRQLNSGKFKMLHELEEQLPYRPFVREWQLLGEGRDLKLYSKLTTVETFLPVSFSVLFLGLLAWCLWDAIAL